MIDLPPIPKVSDDLIAATVYDVSTGEIVLHLSGKRSQVEAELPAGTAYIVGVFDALTHFVDANGKVAVRRKQAEIDSAIEARTTRERSQAAAMAIVRLEEKQARALREKELGKLTQIEYRDRLQGIEDEIVALRAIINP